MIKISKNSLLIRMVFYNNIAIVVASVTIALFLIFIAFQNIESKIVDSVRDKIVLVNRAYKNEILRTKDDLNRIVRKNDIKIEIGENKDKNIIMYKKAAKQIYRQLLKLDDHFYRDSIISIVDGNGDILAEESGINIPSQISKEDFNKNFTNGSAKTSYFFKVGENLYSRIIIKYDPMVNNLDEELYIVVTFKITNSVLEELGMLAGLSDQDKIFLLIDGSYNSGTFDHLPINAFRILPEDNIGKVKTNQYFYRKKIIDGTSYYVAVTDLSNYDGSYVGAFGVAIYYENIEIMKIVITLSILLIILLFVGISTAISAKLFSKLLEPLSKIVDAAEEVSRGNYDICVKPEGVDEMRTLSRTFNKMAEDIRENEKKSYEKNQKLITTLKKIDAIEKILMNIQIEDDITTTVNGILYALTSDLGLGYSRAMYFRYSREIDTMVGELSVVNNKIKKDALNNNMQAEGFKFQVEELEKLVKLIRVPFKCNNLIAKALIEKRIISFNDKGYKHSLGNEMFNSLGIRNFLIMPIYSENRNYGCILIDYFGKDNEVTQEEKELLTLLFLNLSFRIKNKTLEEEKIDYERTAMIGKLVDRFFTGREVSFEKMLQLLKKMYEYDYNNPLLKIQIQEINNEITKLKREREILNEYVEVKECKSFEIIDIDKLLSELINEMEEEFKNNLINVSLFINSQCNILGNKKNIKKAFYEVIKNAKESFEKKPEENNKKINIIVTKEKNVDKIKISITDNGIGMTKEQLEKVFEPFVSYNPNTTGLGLSIVSRIIKEHNGVIKFSSTIGEGTEVKITLNIHKEEIL